MMRNGQLNNQVKDIRSVDSPVNLPLLSVETLTCERSDVALFSNLSFSLQKSQCLRILGPNGSGKSTLIRAIAGIHKPVHGSIHWNPVAEDSHSQTGRPKIAYIGHATGLNNELTALENLAFYASIHGNLSGLSPTECLEKLNIAHCSSLPCTQLSAGQRQRVALARLVLNQYDLWLLDEPATSLDDQGIELLLNLGGTCLKAGGGVVYCSHQPLNFRGEHDSINLLNFKDENAQC